MFCKYCGVPVDEDSIFCKSCGKRIDVPNEVRSIEPSVFDATVITVQPDFNSATPLPQPSKICSRILAIIALVFSVAFAGATNSIFVPLALSSAFSLAQFACVFAVIGSFIKGKPGDILFSIGVFLMCFASLGDLAYAKNQGWLGIILVIVGVLLKLCLVLSGMGILVRRKAAIMFGSFLNLVGVITTNLIFMIVFTPSFVQGEYDPSLLILSLLASVSFTIGVITYKTSNRGGIINVL